MLTEKACAATKHSLHRYTRVLEPRRAHATRPMTPQARAFEASPRHAPSTGLGQAVSARDPPAIPGPPSQHPRASPHAIARGTARPLAPATAPARDIRLTGPPIRDTRDHAIMRMPCTSSTNRSYSHAHGAAARVRGRARWYCARCSSINTCPSGSSAQTARAASQHASQKRCTWLAAHVEVGHQEPAHEGRPTEPTIASPLRSCCNEPPSAVQLGERTST